MWSLNDWASAVYDLPFNYLTLIVFTIATIFERKFVLLLNLVVPAHLKTPEDGLVGDRNVAVIKFLYGTYKNDSIFGQNLSCVVEVNNLFIANRNSEYFCAQMFSSKHFEDVYKRQIEYRSTKPP